MTWLLVHSPLVGPSCWAPVAAEATMRGIEVIVPDLRIDASVPPPLWKAYVRPAIDACSDCDEVTVIGHSGAGVFLPHLGMSLGNRPTGLVFVDAVIPPPTGSHSTPKRIADFLDRHVSDGVLANWFEWWPKGEIEELIPDSTVLESLRSEAPNVPRRFYDEEIPVPKGWTDMRADYLLLSSAYDDEATRAIELGWSVVTLDSTHLGIVTDPGPVVDFLERLNN